MNISFFVLYRLTFRILRIGNRKTVVDECSNWFVQINSFIASLSKLISDYVFIFHFVGAI